ncbi:MAG TPA: hypothetical protein VNQ90_19905 [Chthoniobacteraceae bacterium]|nr:hypothetical protein [Chthoniobacteraceae bacterium]
MTSATESAPTPRWEELVAASTQFVCSRWGEEEAGVEFFAPVTCADGVFWIHPAWAREYRWPEIRRRATAIWRISGSFWNPGTFRLVHCGPGGPSLREGAGE